MNHPFLSNPAIPGSGDLGFDLNIMISVIVYRL